MPAKGQEEKEIWTMVEGICQKQSHWLEQFITSPGLPGSAGPPAVGALQAVWSSVQVTVN